MYGLIKQFKREFVYSSYLFLVLELLVTRQFVVNIYVYITTALVGLLLISSWFVTSFGLFGRKRVSKKSRAVITVNLKYRVFTYVVMPVILWVSLCLYLFFTQNVYITQTVIVASVALYFAFMLQVRSSLEKIYHVDTMTRFVYDFINIVVFFLLLSVLCRLGLDIYLMTGVVILFTLLSLHNTLYVHRKLEVESTLVALFASAMVGLATWATQGMNIYTQPSLITLLYYLIVSLWNIRFSGARKLEDYIPPIMYTLMAVILVLSL
ncbi:MAG: hypothetical protein UT34_C0002G0192 [candidate division WS6 bacterium GW2011_GWF2_39_15]|uniref:Uncharacterized protein n=1 Tax=candidate division WS6 bacterium GW2011_GWF2_39_15 TaxID=1619100 RepID=A0A0G0Q5K0_9BACT|nr:MAG: hypothetical protein UT34_C0002G0192 [candidate division WS6 bacterium GW2011_GWF2_39_15]